ncbi:hypothetical protein PIB30_084490 [Stylosanthes scabra]|uniref:Putative plant transposon protein domain-containing protein n=1 Tax=Stylosanthes scabra TaxID=79078 RepID=A0ABU6WS81_9FABA|nr:hypothetical protein [Stylosanthes scabra]
MLLEDKQPFKFGESVQPNTFESHVRRKKVIPEVGFNLNDDEYPQIKEQIALRGWRRLAAPMTGISKLLVQEFYANATISDEEVANAEQLPYMSFVRGVEVDFSSKNIRRVMRFKAETLGAKTDYKTRQATDQRLDEVLADLCIPGATWRLSLSQPAVPIQLRKTKLHPLANGWQEFIIHSLVPIGNKSKITVARAILIYSIIRGEEVRAEDIIADNMAVIAQGLQSKGNLGFPSTIHKLCKDASVPLREFRRTSKIPEEKLITAKRMGSTRIPKICHNNSKRKMMKMNQCLKQEKAMKKKKSSSSTRISSNHHNNLSQTFSHTMRANTTKTSKELKSTSQACNLCNKASMRTFRNHKPNTWKRQGKDISEIRKQLNLWTRNTSAREAYTCWAHQQANPNLSEIPITQILDLMQTRPSASSQTMGQALPPKLINKTQCHCGLHPLFRITNHLVLLQISPKVI